jgi:galactose-1-phosphate uridylyltransferase
VPWNAWLYSAPLRGSDHGLHWHLEALPRLGVIAGMELGAGLPICPIDPEAAAQTLRGGLSGERR